MIDAVDQLDLDRRRHRMHGVGIFVRQHQFIIGTRNQRQRAGHGGEIAPVAAGREIAHQPVRIAGRQNLFGIGWYREGERRQRFAAIDAEAAQRQQSEDAWNVGRGPAARGPIGRGIIAEIGRKQHGARKQVLDRRTRKAKRKATARRVAKQRQRRSGRGLAHDCDKILKIVFELADIGDVAARAGAAMAANVGRVGLDAPCTERVRQRMQRDARSRRAVHENGDLVRGGSPRRIVPVRQFRAVAGGKALQRRHRAAINGASSLRYRG